MGAAACRPEPGIGRRRPRAASRRADDMTVLTTDRLVLRHLSLDDAEFILGLVNEPSWLQYIGDRGVRTLDDARAYIRNGPVDMYERLGYGLYLVELAGLHQPIGICGVLKRDTLDDADIGFAFLPGYWGQGYAYESASAVLAYARKTLGMTRVLAITSLDNYRSIKLLEKMGFSFDRMVVLGENQPESRLFVSQPGGSS
jgi:RimJ/RimL family protein N-acetyltransferase